MSEERVIRHLAADDSIYVHAAGENCDFEGECPAKDVPERVEDEDEK